MDVCLFLCNTIFVYGGIKSGTVLAVNLEEGSAQPVLVRRTQRIDFVVRCWKISIDNQYLTKRTAHLPPFETGQMCSVIYNPLIINLLKTDCTTKSIRRRRCCIVVYSRKTMCTGVVPEKMTEFQRKIAHCHKICVSLRDSSYLLWKNASISYRDFWKAGQSALLPCCSYCFQSHQ